MSEQTNEELRAAIKTALRRRDPDAEVSVERNTMALGNVYYVASSVVDVAHLIGNGSTEADSLRSLALAAGLRTDGSDPAAEVERLTAELDRAHHALREYGPRCAHPDCDALAPLRCDDCGARFCDAHDESSLGHNEIAGDRHAVGPDDLRAGAALRAAGGGR